MDAVLYFGPIADVRERTELAGRLHEWLRFPPGMAPSLLPYLDQESSARTVCVSLIRAGAWCQFCHHCFSPVAAELAPGQWVALR